MSKRSKRILLIVLGLPALLVAVYFLPPVHARLAWRVAELRTAIVYFFNPPEQVTFQPEQGAQIQTVVAATMQAIQTASVPTSTPRPTAGPTQVPTVTPTPLPEAVSLPGVKYEHQHGRWNYCGPANFSMALTFWGWDGNRDVIGQTLKPNDKDKNVMPYELQDFVNESVPGMKMAVRMGGESALLKRLIAGGYPVVIEKGYYEADYTGKVAWMGHYLFVTGYDDAQGVFIGQDTYLEPGEDRPTEYAAFDQEWRSFNYLFFVIYPQERELEVFRLLGPWADEIWSYQHALDIARVEAAQLSGVDQFFAQFNLGTSYTRLQQYAEGSFAYDQAFADYNALPDDGTRPYRMLWYQTWPYWAYYYSVRYQDVVSLANTTLNDTIAEPVLEESLYWRGMGEYALGNVQPAIDDFRAALRINPTFVAAVIALQNMGVQP